MRTHNFHTNQPDPICKFCGLEKDDHRRIQILDESTYHGDYGADFYCRDGSGREFYPETQDDREERLCRCVGDDGPDCPIHGIEAMERRQLEREAEAEAIAAERMGILMGFDREEK